MTDAQNGIYGFATDLDYFFPLSVGEDVIKFKNGKAELNLVNNPKIYRRPQLFHRHDQQGQIRLSHPLASQ